MAFATKPRQGMAMLESAVRRGVPYAWVAADVDYARTPPCGVAARAEDPVRARGTGIAAGRRPAGQGVPAQGDSGR